MGRRRDVHVIEALKSIQIWENMFVDVSCKRIWIEFQPESWEASWKNTPIFCVKDEHKFKLKGTSDSQISGVNGTMSVRISINRCRDSDFPRHQKTCANDNDIDRWIEGKSVKMATV